MSNAPNVQHSPDSLGEATERLREKWAAIAAFGVLLVVFGAAAIAFSLAATIVTVTLNGVLSLIAGAAEIGIGMPPRARGPVDGPRDTDDEMEKAHSRLGRVDASPRRRRPRRRRSGARLAGRAASPDRPRGLGLLAAAVTILIGLIIVSHWPLDSVYVLGTLLGVDLLFHGVGWVSFGMGLQVRCEAPGLAAGR
jgi:uncharacterized membrane protein HdeD (DUF308 family)